MWAIVIEEFGGPEVLSLREVPDPSAGKGEVCIHVAATAVNRADLLQRMGHYPAPAGAPSNIPGLEFVGVVERVGDGVSRCKVGDRVMGIAGGGTYAERVVVHEGVVMPAPSSLSDSECAAIPEAFVTAHDALVTIGGLKSSMNVLVHAVGSGVGLAAAQLASALGAKVFGTARTGDKRERSKELGVSVALDPDGFGEALLEATNKRGADVIVDFVGAGYLEQNLVCLARRGTLVSVGTMGGPVGEIDLGLLMRKRARIEGTVLRSRSNEEKAEAVDRFYRDCSVLFAQAKVRPVVDRVLPLANAAEAHAIMGRNENFGKIVLVMKK